MDSRPQETQENKDPVSRYTNGTQWEHSDEPSYQTSADSAASDAQDDKRPIRRVRSPTRPRAWLSKSYKPKPGEPFNRPRFPRDDPSFYKPGFNNQRRQYFDPRAYGLQRDHFQHKRHHSTPRERERHEQRESTDGSSSPKQNNTTRPFLPRSASSRDKDTQFTVQNDRNQNRESDHRGTKSKERERSRDWELPSTGSQTAARDRAIQQKRREIDEVYYQECETFGLVAKMLIAKDPSLEQSIQSSLQENLRDIGKRCVAAMEKFIENYDSREPSHCSGSQYCLYP
ncbi:periphilin-1 [Embiotoca jacksoni]|uniref:periphilin-1 n=1 Tax=Embiotoca jacksoni TaxID=100190 RepID=UPI003704AB51